MLLHISKKHLTFTSLLLVFKTLIIFHNPDKTKDSKVKGISPSTLLIPIPANNSKILGEFFKTS